jgi:hypothetical protein
LCGTLKSFRSRVRFSAVPGAEILGRSSYVLQRASEDAANLIASYKAGYAILDAMSTNVKIEVDERTADVLQARAAELGVTVSELVAELATLDTDAVVVESDEIAELDRRWRKLETGASAIRHEHVVRWLRTWGTPGFRPWRAQ